MNNKDLTNKVTLVLVSNIPSRDCDVTLYIGILKIYNAQHITAMQLMYEVKNGNVPSYDSISRIRRKVQQENKSLRGQIWAKRHNEKQDKAKSDLGYAIN
jgi:hypothetical protein